MPEHNFFRHKKNFRRPNGTHENCLLEESERMKEKVKKLTSVLHRVWSIEKTTLQKANFLKNAQICVETSESARRAPLGESPEKSAFAPLRRGWDPLYGGEHPELNQVESPYGVNTKAEWVHDTHSSQSRLRDLIITLQVS